MAKNVLGSSFDVGRHFGSRDAESLLQVFFVADEHVDVLDDAPEDGAARARAPPDALQSFSR